MPPCPGSIGGDDGIGSAVEATIQKAVGAWNASNEGMVLVRCARHGPGFINFNRTCLTEGAKNAAQGQARKRKAPDLKTVPVEQHQSMLQAIAKEFNGLITIGTFTGIEVPHNRKAISSRQIDSLIFDGGLLRKREGLGRTEVDALLLRMQATVKANVGVNVEIAVEIL